MSDKLPNMLKSAEPLVSVVTVTFNAQATIAGTLESIASQSYRNFEWVVIDGASKDETVRLVEASRSRFPSLTLLSEQDQGLYDAMNKAIGAARGQYLIFINSGDGLVDPEVLSDFASWLQAESESPAMIYGHTLIEFQNGSQFLRKVRPLKYIAQGQPTLHQSVFFRRDVHANHPYPFDTYRISSDYAVMGSIQLSGGGVVIWDRVVSRFGNDTQSVSNRSLWPRVEEAWNIQKRVLNSSLAERLLSATRRVLANIYYNFR